MDAPATLTGYRLQSGSDVPLGAHWDGSGTNFALYSANATKVELCLFDSRGKREIERVEMPEFTHQVWHGYLPEVRPGQLYGYRVHGPYAPEEGHRFNPNKLLLDPYALQHHGNLRWHDALFGYKVGHEKGDLSFDRRDSAFVMPKCVVVDPSHTWGGDVRPNVPWGRTIVYEAHVGGMTAGRSDIEPHLRGTFEGLADPRVIEHLVNLGVTSLELLPVQAFYDDRHLVENGLANWWGYNTLGFFAPHTAYASSSEVGGQVREFKQMVKDLHAAGLEVILDVVYNHTAEEGPGGPTSSFRGLDNASYYRQDERGHYIDVTGCGNTLDFSNPVAQRLVLDSLRYWANDVQVDGFRFDLAATLGRDGDVEFQRDHPLLTAIIDDPALRDVKMIAEPWDVGLGGWQVGNFPDGYSEWNDGYRDRMRNFWLRDIAAARHTDGLPSEGIGSLARRLAGSNHVFSIERGPLASVNFITAHDGFTAADLVAYNDKHNLGNGEDNRDGSNDNKSFNHGVEGRTSDPEILRTRRRAIRGWKVSRSLPTRASSKSTSCPPPAGRRWSHRPNGSMTKRVKHAWVPKSSCWMAAIPAPEAAIT